MCTNYMSGFCPIGPKCKSMHPRFELPRVDTKDNLNRVKCHHCNEPGHVITHCPLRNILPNQPSTSINNPVLKTITPGMTIEVKRSHDHSDTPPTPFNNTLVPVNNSGYVAKPLHTVTCFKCGEKGHYANNCALAKKNLNLSKMGGFKIVNWTYHAVLRCMIPKSDSTSVY